MILFPSTLSADSESNPNASSPSIAISPACDLAVVVPADFHLCDGEDYNLCGVITSPYNNIDYVWTENGNSTNYDLCETIDIEEETTFVLSATAISDDNLITNGDFENGDDGSFSTIYEDALSFCLTHGSGYLGCEGVYAIVDDPSDGHTNFDPCPDNTSGSGNMMVVNGASSLLEIWCQDICVDGDASYLFSSWATSVNSASPAILQFSIDGNLIGSTFDLSSSTCSWEQFEADWQANGESSVEICVTNQNTAADGNDFALDDIEFYQVCEEQAEFTVTVSALDIYFYDIDELTCLEDEVRIDIEIDPIQNYQDIIWDTFDGEIEDDNGESIYVSKAGTYFVTVTDEYGCDFTNDVEVEANIEEPTLAITGSTLLSCNSNSTTLFADTNADEPIYEWMNSQGMIIGNQPMINVTTAGEIELRIIDDENGCEVLDEINITIDTAAVDFDLVKSGNLTCSVSKVQIHTTESQDSVSWSNNIGTIISEHNDTIQVTQAGDYYATVTKPNGCVHIDTIKIIELIPTFDYQKNFEDFIYCDNPDSEVSISYDSNLYNFIWTGNASSLGSDSDLQISQEGTYTFQLTDANGCIKKDSIEITENFFVPEIFSSADTITCTKKEAEIRISWSENTTWLTDVEWEFPDGSSSIGGIATKTNQSGWVNYEAIMPITGCRIIDSIYVEVSNDFPLASIKGDTLTCLNRSVTLTTEASADVTTYGWLLPDGTQNSNPSFETTLGGSYTLEVENASGCKATVQYMVVENIAEPQIDLAPLAKITCLDSIAKIDVNISTPYTSVLWSGPNLNIDSLNLETKTEGDYELTVIGDNGCISKENISISLDTIPTTGWEILPPQLLSCTLTSFKPEFSENQNELQNFTWETPTGNVIDINDLTITEPGTYLFQVTGENGCPNVIDYLVEQKNDRPQFIHDSTPITCDINLTEITASAQDPDLQFEYINANTNANIGTGSSFSADDSEPINVIATDANGCTSIQAVVFSYDTLAPILSATAGILDCNNLFTTVSIQSSQILEEKLIYDSNDTYLGNDGYEIKEAGDYYVLGSSTNGCTTALPIEISIDTSTVAFELSSEILSCDVSSVPLNLVTADTFDFATLSSLSSSEIENINYGEEFSRLSLEGIYEVTVTGINGCTSAETIEILKDGGLISFSLSAENLDCNKTTTEIVITSSDIYTSGYAIHLGTQEAYSDLSSLWVNEAGIYEVYLTGVNGCEIKQTIEILNDDSQIDFSLDAETLTCNKISTEIEIISTENYISAFAFHIESQTTYADPNAFAVSLPGIYEVYVTGSNGCESFQTIEVEQIIDTPQLDAIDVETLSCKGDGQVNAITITGGSPPYLVSIDNGPLEEFISAISVTGAGTHQVVIEDLYGCQGEGSFILDPIEEITASLPPEVLINEAKDRELILEINKPLEEIESIDWQPRMNLSCYNCLETTFVGDSSATYTVYIEDKYGCETKAQIQLLVPASTDIYVPNVISLENDAQNNRFTLFSNESALQITEMYIYDRWGNLMFYNEAFTANDLSQGWDGYFLEKRVAQGVYTYMAKVLKQNGETDILSGDLTVIY